MNVVSGRGSIFSVSVARSFLFAATPPPRTTVFGLCSAIALSVLETSTSTIACSSEAEKSAMLRSGFFSM